MKIIILAAGKGNRMGSLTKNGPKCMVNYNRKPIIDYILETVKLAKINDISIVAGYKNGVLKDYLKNQNINFYINENYKFSNMVYSLFIAKEFMDDDLIISYSDIIYKKSVLEKLIRSKKHLSVVVDKNWEILWKMRMENYFSDIETLRIRNQEIIEIGKKPRSLTEVAGQYIGLLKISKKIINKISEFYFSLDKKKYYEGRDFNNMHMTSFLQKIIEDCEGINLSPVYINGGWIEFDTIQDLQRYDDNKIYF